MILPYQSFDESISEKENPVVGPTDDSNEQCGLNASLHDLEESVSSYNNKLKLIENDSRKEVEIL